MRVLTLDDDTGTMSWQTIEVAPPAPPSEASNWEDVTAEFLFSTRGGRPNWINVGAGGQFWVKARFGPGWCKIKAFARFGDGWSCPNDSQWFLYPLTPRVTPIERGVGMLRLWFEGQGSITGGQSGTFSTGSEPALAISALWTAMDPNPGWLTAEYPRRGGIPMWAKNGSYFLIDALEYETAVS